MFNEARLAARNRGAEKRRRVIGLIAWSLPLLLLLGGGFFGYTAWSGEKARAERLARRWARPSRLPRAIPFDASPMPSSSASCPYLAAARDLAAGGARGRGLLAWAQWRRSWRRARRGLSPGAGAGAFLPRSLARLELQIRGGFQRPDFLWMRRRAST